MRCDEFHKRWQFLLDERRSPEADQSLCEHAEVCRDCREILRVQAVLFRELDRTRPVRAVIEPSRRAQPLAKALLIGLSVACSLFVAVIPAWRHFANRDRIGRESARAALAERRGAASVVWVAKTPSAVRPSTKTEATASSASDTQTLGMTAEQESLRKLMQDMAARLPGVPEKQLEPLDTIAGGFRPLANTLGVAWDALRRTIPVGRGQTVQEPQAILGWPGFPVSPV